MSQPDRLPPPIGRVLLACLAVACGTLAASSHDSTSSAPHCDPSPPVIVAPPDRAVLMSGNLDVIYRGGDTSLKVDSQPKDWDPNYASPVRVGHLHLSPGMHRLEIGERRILFCVALNEMEHDGPSDWPIHKLHTMSHEADRCTECHQTQPSGNRLAVGLARIPQACMECHRQDELKEPHQPFASLPADCRQCHALHGSPFPSLLKAPKQKILDQFTRVAPQAK